MAHRFWFIALIIALIFILINVSATNNQALIQQVDELVAEYVQPGGPGCAVAVIKNGEVIYRQTYGMMNLEYDLPMSSETVFNLGSVSKQFTAACVLLLANENRLSLDDDIHTYLPEWPDYGHKITIRHLLHHTSGIIDYDWLQALAGWKETSPGREFTLDLIKRVKELNFPPGLAYYYSNSGYLLLGLIVERVSGMPLSAFAAEHIFKPLRMEQTLMHDDAGLIIKQRADSYTKTDQGGYIGLRGYQSTTVGDNNVYATIGDMIKWDENFRKETVGGKGFAGQMFTRGVLNSGDTTIYAMGLVVEPYRGLRSVSHGGLTQGYKSHYLQFPDQRFSVICLANGLDIDAGKICRSIADIYLEDQLADQPAASIEHVADEIEPSYTIDAAGLGEYAGRYGINGNLVMVLSQRDGVLYGQVPGQPEVQFFPKDKDIFYLKVVEAEGSFERDSNGQISGLIWHQGGRSTPMTKMEDEPLTAWQLQNFSGIYYSPVLQTVYRISVKDGRLWLTMPEMPEMLNIPRPAAMNHIQGNHFAVPYATIEFALAGDDSVSGFKYEHPSGRIQLQFEKQSGSQ